MSWPDRKLSDEPEEVEQHLLNPNDDPTMPTATVVAPCCGQRRCAADMVAWVPGEGWCCDACRSRLRRDNGTDWTKPKLMRAMGAPVASVRREEVKRRARARYIAAKKRNDAPVSRTQVIQEVQADVAKGRYPDGTEPPETSGRTTGVER